MRTAADMGIPEGTYSWAEQVAATGGIERGVWQSNHVHRQALDDQPVLNAVARMTATQAGERWRATYGDAPFVVHVWLEREPTTLGTYWVSVLLADPDTVVPQPDRGPARPGGFTLTA